MPKSIRTKSIIYKIPNNYYEAIIQLRPFNDDVFLFIEKQINDHKNVFISKVLQQKTGIDIYMSSQKLARKLGPMLKKKFNCEIKISKKLYGQDRLTSKLLYRATVLVRMKD